MAKQLVGEAKFQVPGGQATPAPPVGTSLGKFGINLGQFVQQFNDRTKEYNGTPIPVIVTVYADRTFDFVTKSPPAASLLKQAAGIAKGSTTRPGSGWPRARANWNLRLRATGCKGTRCPRANWKLTTVRWIGLQPAPAWTTSSTRAPVHEPAFETRTHHW